MQSFQIHRGIAVPLNRDNIDTDAIIPKQFLKSIKRTGFGENLFDAWRYLDTGELGKQQRIINPDFVLNQKQFAGASILITGKNFGCGSSREHAPWALQQFGFRVIIAESYADIFFNNCFKIGLLPIVLAQSQIENLTCQIKTKLGVEVTVDLEKQVVIAPDQQAFAFEIEPFRRECLLNGWDDIGLTLRYEHAIRAFENERLAKMPWLNAELSS